MTAPSQQPTESTRETSGELTRQTRDIDAPLPAVRAVQRLLDPLFVPLVGEHLVGKPERSVTAAGLVIDQAQRPTAGITLRLAATTHLAHLPRSDQ